MFRSFTEHSVQFGSQEYRGSRLSVEKDGSLWIAVYTN